MKRTVKFRGRMKSGRWITGQLMGGAPESYRVDGYYSCDMDQESISEFVCRMNDVDYYELDCVKFRCVSKPGDKEQIGVILYVNGKFQIVSDNGLFLDRMYIYCDELNGDMIVDYTNLGYWKDNEHLFSDQLKNYIKDYLR